MSIDLYPYLDLSQSNPNVSKEVGAASLLYKNKSSLWPEFDGKDLVSCYPNIKFFNLSEDGATTYDFLDPGYLNLLSDYANEVLIVTITLGGNDLLRLINLEQTGLVDLEKGIDDLVKRYEQASEMIMNAFPRSICILNTIYDPSDGTGVIPGFPNFADKLTWLERVNKHISNFAIEKNALLAKIHKTFLGHGLSAPVQERWYWSPNPIEPSARGASEIRRLWLEVLSAEDLLS
jgi:lysophospholipase L1-like esterase